ncbi:MAG: hypothetical protein ACFFB3_00350 [Candidatus Hodarchaeota archaeon]
MGALKVEVGLSDQSLQEHPDPDSLDATHPISIRRGRKQALFIYTVNYLSQQRDSFGKPFQPCPEDLLYLYGGNRKQIGHVIQVLRRKEYLRRISVEVEKYSRYLPDLLVVSKQGVNHLRQLQENGLTSYKEWQQVQPRIKQLLNEPQPMFLSLRRVIFFQVRELVRLITPFLPPIPGLDNQFVAKIVAFDKGKSFSPAELSQQILGSIDVLLRLQGDYIPNETLSKIMGVLNNHGLLVNLTKRKLYPYIQLGARLFGAGEHSERKNSFYEAVKKALNHYCESFAIEESIREQILAVNDHLRADRRISLDPEARALGIIGFIVPGFFLNDNSKKYPLSPEMWLTGRDQMHQIRKLFRKLDL